MRTERCDKAVHEQMKISRYLISCLSYVYIFLRVSSPQINFFKANSRRKGKKFKKKKKLKKMKN